MGKRGMVEPDLGYARTPERVVWVSWRERTLQLHPSVGAWQQLSAPVPLQQREGMEDAAFNIQIWSCPRGFLRCAVLSPLCLGCHLCSLHPLLRSGSAF